MASLRKIKNPHDILILYLFHWPQMINIRGKVHLGLPRSDHLSEPHFIYPCVLLGFYQEAVLWPYLFVVVEKRTYLFLCALSVFIKLVSDSI